MFLQSYVPAGCGDTELLAPAVVAAMAPLWVGRTPSEEIVGIGSTGISTGAIITWPLADLRDEVAASRFFRAFLQTRCRTVWLLAFTADPAACAAPLAHLAAAASGTGLGNDRTVVVTEYGRRWAKAHRSQGPGLTELDFQPVAEIDPAAARMWLLACRAGCEQGRTLQALRSQPAPAMAEAADRARESINRARHGIDAAVQAAHAAAAFRQALTTEPELPNVRDTVLLGTALAKDSALLAAAIDVIWTARSTAAARCDLWQHLAHLAIGDAHATTVALAAFAAWRTGDLAYATAALEYADGLFCGGSPLTGWLGDLIAHGVPATDLDAGVPLIPAHLHTAIAGATDRDGRA